jgi:tetratricopeptide (TPR) repeat protein
VPITKLPPNLRQHLINGRNFYNEGNLSEAKKELRIVTDLGKFHAPTHYLLAVTEDRLGNRNEAEKYITLVIKKRGPYQVWGCNLRAQMNEKAGNIKEAMIWYEKAFKMLPSHVPFVEKLISMKREQKDFKGVELLMRHHIAYDVRNVDKWKMLQEIYENLGDNYSATLCKTNILKITSLGI